MKITEKFKLFETVYAAHSRLQPITASVQSVLLWPLRRPFLMNPCQNIVGVRFLTRSVDLSHERVKCEMKNVVILSKTELTKS